MMAISKALDEIKFRIPRAILERVFLQKEYRWRAVPTSLDDVILATVIRPRVMVDCNLVGGAEVLIPLEGATAERVDDLTMVFHIPKSLTQNRSIVSVKNITYVNTNRPYTYGLPIPFGGSAAGHVANTILDANSTIPSVSTAKVQLIGENTVLIKDSNIVPNYMHLRCVVENDENMSHLQLRSYHAFSKLVELAVKSYIFNQYAVEMDTAEIKGGAALGRFKEIVDGYSDAEELYQTYLREKWTKIAHMNDRTSWGRTLQLIVGNPR